MANKPVWSWGRLAAGEDTDMVSAHRGGRWAAVKAGALACSLLLAGCGSDGVLPSPAALDLPAEHRDRTSTSPHPEPPATLTVDNVRRSDGVIAAGGEDAVYNYAPSVLVEDGTVRMWWCSQYTAAEPAGDDILYATASSVDGPYTGPGGGSPAAVFSGNPGGFDAVHTCDPSVLRVDGTYYMYYTGAADDRTHGNSIGLATSPDGVHWTRAGGGAPIVEPAHDVHRDNVYGTGQPAAVYLGGWFYLMFTDTTGADAGANGAGQFVLRSKDPTFGTGVQALGPDGFMPVPGPDATRSHSVVDAFSADLMWVDALEAFAIAHETANGTTITFYDRGFTHHPYQPVLVPGPWEEGPGLVRQPKGHAPVSGTDPCARVPIDLVRATTIGEADAPTGLRHFGLDLVEVSGCATPQRALAVLDGFAVPSPVRTMDLIAGGDLVRVQRRSVAAALADRVLDHRPEALEQLSVSARIPAGAPVLSTDDGSVGLLLDGTLWPVRGLDAAELAELNASPVRTITTAKWNSYPRGAVLGG